jgi:hypothetical protein
MERGMRFVAEKGFSRCYLTTLAGLDSARLFYERAGFRLVEEAPFDGWGPRIREQRFAWAR